MSLFDLKGAFDEMTTKRYALVARTALGPLFDAMMRELDATGGAGFKPQNIVDLGSGPGVMTRRLAERFPDANVIGVEPSRPMLQLANGTTAAKVRFVEGSAEKIPLADRSADLVVSHNSIKHWHDQPGGLAEVMRILKPGGLLWLCEIDKKATWREAWSFLKPTGMPFMVLPFKLRVAAAGLTEKDLARLVKDLPLSDCQVSRIGGLPMIRVMGRRS